MESSILLFSIVCLAILLVVIISARFFSRGLNRRLKIIKAQPDPTAVLESSVLWARSQKGQKKLLKQHDGTLRLKAGKLTLSADEEVFNIPVDELKIEFWGVDMGLYITIDDAIYWLQFFVGFGGAVPFRQRALYEQWAQAIMAHGGPDYLRPGGFRGFWLPIEMKFHALDWLIGIAFIVICALILFANTLL